MTSAASAKPKSSDVAAAGPAFYARKLALNLFKFHDALVVALLLQIQLWSQGKAAGAGGCLQNPVLRAVPAQGRERQPRDTLPQDPD